MKMGVLLVIFTFLFGNIPDQKQDISNEIETCVNKLAEYDGMLMWNNITYSKNYVSDTKGLIRDKKIGEVKFTMSGMVCPGYKMKNGDATIEQVGTPIYSVKGYSEQFRLFIGDNLYEVNDNPHAKTIGDLYDIRGKVSKVTLESIEDNSYIKDFTKDASEQFVEELLKLKYVGFQEVYKETGLNGNKFFIRIYLSDNSSLLISYWSDENIITPGAITNEAFKTIVLSQINN
ncbi:hypothetical protein EDM59_30720 [Brevibacillus nitrificans]|uniref:Uncharacterized protein n=1 Tax=Brevibacillus nitrificans TaxID=651560 RepID=A0A3M8CPR5_9BACL|nr:MULTISPECIES: hypothetical protein [Brevibacillus]MED1949757.1 hypothetical protein [Brevibacillus centrosporus]RNB77760.1 hypothetical protein EDM59_30720 [Brevibacillus nitrificans]